MVLIDSEIDCRVLCARRERPVYPSRHIPLLRRRCLELKLDVGACRCFIDLTRQALETVLAAAKVPAIEEKLWGIDNARAADMGKIALADRICRAGIIERINLSPF